MYLHGIGNYTQYLNDLIDKDLSEKHNENYVHSQIEYHKEEIKKLQDSIKINSIKRDKLNEYIKSIAPDYKKQFENLEQKFRIDRIKRLILPKLKELGYKDSVETIDDIIMGWSD